MEVAGPRGTTRPAGAEAPTPSLGGPQGTQPCDSTAWAGAARAMRVGPGSASSCFKRSTSFKATHRQSPVNLNVESWCTVRSLIVDFMILARRQLIVRLSPKSHGLTFF